jgi:DeoR family transcriptional regulator, glycerol-3-phosphate regulon repressor
MPETVGFVPPRPKRREGRVAKDQERSFERPDEEAARRNAFALNQRQRRILELVPRQGFVSIEALAKHFRVSAQTIRRDINDLCDRALLQRFHGGAGLMSSVENIAYASRQVMSFEEKARIAQLIAADIPDNASVFIDIGTTSEEVAKALRDHRGLRVITNNFNAAAILSGTPSREVLITGGLIRPTDFGIVGEAAEDFIGQFKVDFGIITVSSIDKDGTLLDYDYREVRAAQRIIQNSRRVVLAVDHTKFMRSAMVRVGDLSCVHDLYTDREPPEQIVRIVEQLGVQLHIAEAEPA